MSVLWLQWAMCSLMTKKDNNVMLMMEVGEAFPLAASSARRRRSFRCIQIQVGRQNIQTCCSYFCRSASSCSEKSFAWLSLRDLERIRSSSTFSIWRQKQKIRMLLFWLTRNNFTIKELCCKMSERFRLSLLHPSTFSYSCKLKVKVSKYLNA